MEQITWAINTVWHLIFSRAWLQLKHLWLLILYCLLELQLIIVFISLPIMLFCPMHSPKTWIYLIYFHSSGRRAACIYIWGAHIWRLCSSSLFESQFYHRPDFVFFILCICFVPPPPFCSLSASQSMRSHSLEIENIESWVKFSSISDTFELPVLYAFGE